MLPCNGHWLPDRIPDNLQEYLVRPKEKRKTLVPRMELDLHIDEVAEAVKNSLRESFRQPNLISTKGATPRDENGRLVESGRVLTLKVETKDLDKVRTVIEAQWLAIRMAALSGAGRAPHKRKRKPPFSTAALHPFINRQGQIEWADEVGDEEARPSRADQRGD